MGRFIHKVYIPLRTAAAIAPILVYQALSSIEIDVSSQ